MCTICTGGPEVSSPAGPSTSAGSSVRACRSPSAGGSVRLAWIGAAASRRFGADIGMRNRLLKRPGAVRGGSANGARAGGGRA